MGWRSVREQVQQKANLSPRLTTSEDTWSQLQNARREHQRTRHTIEALTTSRGATALLLEKTGYGGARSEDRVWQVLTETEINLERHVLKPLQGWVRDFSGVQELAAKLEHTRLEVDWRWRQLDKIVADVDHRKTFQTGFRSQQGLPKLLTRQEKKAASLQGARERHANEKMQLDTALAALLESATRHPGIVASAFWLHSDAYKAAATALDNQQQAVAPLAPEDHSSPLPAPASSGPTKAGLASLANGAGPGSYATGPRTGSVPNSGVNSPHTRSRVASAAASRADSADDEHIGEHMRPQHITNIYEQSKARQQQQQHLNRPSGASETGHGVNGGYPQQPAQSAYESARQMREYEPDFKPKTRVAALANQGPTLYEVPSEMNTYDAMSSPGYPEQKMARTVSPRWSKEHGLPDTEQEYQGYRRPSGPSAPPVQGDWKALPAAQPQQHHQGYPVAMNAQSGFAFSPLKQGQLSHQDL